MKKIWTKQIAALTAAACISAAPTLTASAATSTSMNNSTLTSYAEQVLILINQERAAEGLEPLYTTDTLQEAAAVRAEECLTLFSHTRPDGTDCFTILEEYSISYSCAGENIAMGQQTPQAVVNSWMASSGHKANILNESYDYVGIGVASNGTITWVQDFVGGMTLSDATIPTAQNVKGDANYDGEVSLQDSYLVLLAYAKQQVGLGLSLSDTQFACVDVDGDEVITLSDAYYILLYYANQQVGNSVDWDDIVGE